MPCARAGAVPHNLFCALVPCRARAQGLPHNSFVSSKSEGGETAHPDGPPPSSALQLFWDWQDDGPSDL
eukprot:1006567-Prymnesium_polylepis.1